MAIRLEAIATKVEAIPTRVEAIAIRLEAIPGRKAPLIDFSRNPLGAPAISSWVLQRHCLHPGGVKRGI